MGCAEEDKGAREPAPAAGETSCMVPAFPAGDVASSSALARVFECEGGGGGDCGMLDWWAPMWRAIDGGTREAGDNVANWILPTFAADASACMPVE